MAEKKKQGGIKKIYDQARKTRQREVDAIVARLAREEGTQTSGLENLGAGLGLSDAQVQAGSALPRQTASTARIGVLKDYGRESASRGVVEEVGREGYLRSLNSSKLSGEAMRDQLAAGVELASIQAEEASRQRAEARAARAAASNLAERQYADSRKDRAEDIAFRDKQIADAAGQNAEMLANTLLNQPALDIVAEITATGEDKPFTAVILPGTEPQSFSGINDFYATVNRTFNPATLKLINAGLVQDQITQRALPTTDWRDPGGFDFGGFYRLGKGIQKAGSKINSWINPFD